MATSKVLNVIAGVAAGAAAGAALSILFAPDKGSNTRKKIYKKGEEFTEDLKDKFNKSGEFISEKLDGTKKEARDLIETGRSKVNEVKKEAKSAMS